MTTTSFTPHALDVEFVKTLSDNSITLQNGGKVDFSTFSDLLLALFIDDEIRYDVNYKTRSNPFTIALNRVNNNRQNGKYAELSPYDALEAMKQDFRHYTNISHEQAIKRHIWALIKPNKLIASMDEEHVRFAFYNNSFANDYNSMVNALRQDLTFDGKKINKFTQLHVEYMLRQLFGNYAYGEPQIIEL